MHSPDSMIVRVRPLVLCYHGVSDSWNHSLAVTTDAFERQLRSLLRRGYRPVRAAQALAGGGRLVHVTFDDAYKNVADALPILERLGVHATVFACAGYAVDGRPLDVPEVAAAAAADPEHMATMNWDELEALAERGVEIGSHTITHPHLPRLGDSELDRELRDSRTMLEDRLGRPCRFLAYPYGDDDERVYRAAERAGYEGAFSLRGGDGRHGRFAIPRVDIYRRDNRVHVWLKTSLFRRPAIAVAARWRALH
jgi:peptidoglycan/xylan/chitin deacetylase (PgdA/CDA1 family)